MNDHEPNEGRSPLNLFDLFGILVIGATTIYLFFYIIVRIVKD